DIGNKRLRQKKSVLQPEHQRSGAIRFQNCSEAVRDDVAVRRRFEQIFVALLFCLELCAPIYQFLILLTQLLIGYLQFFKRGLKLLERFEQKSMLLQERVIRGLPEIFGANSRFLNFIEEVSYAHEKFINTRFLKWRLTYYALATSV